MIPWVKNQFFTLYKRNLSFFFLLLTQSDPIYSIASRCHHCGRSKHAPQSQTRNAPERTTHPRDSRNQEPDSPPPPPPHLTRKRRARDASAGIEEQVGEVGGFRDRGGLPDSGAPMGVDPAQPMGIWRWRSREKKGFLGGGGFSSSGRGLPWLPVKGRNWKRLGFSFFFIYCRVW